MNKLPRTYQIEYLQFLDEFLREYKELCYKELNINSDSIILDLGCGLGFDTFRFSKLAKQVVGIDIDNEFLDYAINNNIASNIEYKKGSVFSIPYPDEYFNIIFIDRVLQHIPEKEIDVGFKEMKRCLKPNGKLFISETDYASWTWFSENIEIEKKSLKNRETKQNNVYASRNLDKYLNCSNFNIQIKDIYQIKIYKLEIAEKVLKISDQIENETEILKIKNDNNFCMAFNMIYLIVNKL